jgi:hypothetical protein
MHHHSLTIRSAARRVLVFATALAALAVAAPLANAARSHTRRRDRLHPGRDGPNCSSASQRSPYPGWVQVTDEIGVPTLYKVGYESTSTAPCIQTTTTETTPARRRPRARSPVGRR